jgi:hypothetical protein
MSYRDALKEGFALTKEKEESKSNLRSGAVLSNNKTMLHFIKYELWEEDQRRVLQSDRYFQTASISIAKGARQAVPNLRGACD